jgi:RIO-like serine/threonine protein kinase
MKLIRHNKEKNRFVYFCDDRYKKIWRNQNSDWIKNHVSKLDQLLPGYVLDYGNNWIDFRIIKGTLVSTLPHTDELIKKVYKFCIDNIAKTSPYAHGDWTLSNMIINGDTILLCDWDNVGIYPQDEIMQKLNNDLESAFGDKFKKVIYDSSII